LAVNDGYLKNNAETPMRVGADSKPRRQELHGGARSAGVGIFHNLEKKGTNEAAGRKTGHSKKKMQNPTAVYVNSHIAAKQRHNLGKKRRLDGTKKGESSPPPIARFKVKKMNGVITCLRAGSGEVSTAESLRWAPCKI